MTSDGVMSVLLYILCHDNYEPRAAICRLSRVGPTDRCCAARARAPAPTLCWGGREGQVTVSLRCRCVSCIHCLQPARHILSIQADFTFLADFSLDTGHWTLTFHECSPPLCLLRWLSLCNCFSHSRLYICFMKRFKIIKCQKYPQLRKEFSCAHFIPLSTIFLEICTNKNANKASRALKILLFLDIVYNRHHRYR